jgi:hypothetical protein
MSKATEDLMDSLHGLHALTLLDVLKKYKNGDIKDENDKPMSPPPAFLAQVAKFLKDNGIDRPAATNDTLDVLAGELPNFDDFDNVVGISN